jgi:hypothetical protein
LSTVGTMAALYAAAFSIPVALTVGGIVYIIGRSENAGDVIANPLRAV